MRHFDVNLEIHPPPCTIFSAAIFLQNIDDHVSPNVLFSLLNCPAFSGRSLNFSRQISNGFFVLLDSRTITEDKQRFDLTVFARVARCCKLGNTLVVKENGPELAFGEPNSSSN